MLLVVQIRVVLLKTHDANASETAASLSAEGKTSCLPAESTHLLKKPLPEAMPTKW